jgi:hypothetical protein
MIKFLPTLLAVAVFCAIAIAQDTNYTNSYTSDSYTTNSYTTDSYSTDSYTDGVSNDDSDYDTGDSEDDSADSNNSIDSGNSDNSDNSEGSVDSVDSYDEQEKDSLDSFLASHQSYATQDVDQEFTYDSVLVDPNGALMELDGEFESAARSAFALEDDIINGLATLLNIPTSDILLLDLITDGNTYHALVEIFDSYNQSAEDSVQLFVTLKESNSSSLNGTVFQTAEVRVIEPASNNNSPSSGSRSGGDSSDAAFLAPTVLTVAAALLVLA